MKCIARRILPIIVLCLSVLTFAAPVQAQKSVASTRPAISVLDSTKEQDGLVGSVRRVKTETARIEIKEGRPVEGPAQLIEITTYGIKGNRIENTSYPIAGSLVGKEEYKYDKRGNITEMTLRDEGGAILSREAYSYEFDKFGNWTRMVTSLVLFENGELKREPIEVTYRTVTYYFDDNVARAVDESANDRETVRSGDGEKRSEVRSEPPTGRSGDGEKRSDVTSEPPTRSVPVAESVPEAKSTEIQDLEVLAVDYSAIAESNNFPEIGENPPPLALTPATTPVTATAPVTTVAHAPAPAENPANDLYLAGRSRFDGGDYKGAIESYLQSIKLEPRSAEVFLNLGHAYLKLQKDGDAIKAFKQSLKLNPEQAETLYGLGFASFRTGRFREAADAFKKAVTLNPRMAKAHYGLSLAYQELGDTRGVLEEYRILETLDKNLAKKLAQTFPQYNFSCRLVQGCP